MRLRVREYVDEAGRNPYREWIETLDVSMKARAQARILRFELGNLGDHKILAGAPEGLHEARLAFGPGLRIYFGRAGRALVLLLGGGDKSTQPKDIRRARHCWAEYLKATHDETK